MQQLHELGKCINNKKAFQSNANCLLANSTDYMNKYSKSRGSCTVRSKLSMYWGLGLGQFTGWGDAGAGALYRGSGPCTEGDWD